MNSKLEKTQARSRVLRGNTVSHIYLKIRKDTCDYTGVWPHKLDFACELLADASPKQNRDIHAHNLSGNTGQLSK